MVYPSSNPKILTTLYYRYEVKYQNGMDCGGSYMKLLSDVPGLDPVRISSFGLNFFYTVLAVS